MMMQKAILATLEKVDPFCCSSSGDHYIPVIAPIRMDKEGLTLQHQ